ncbi:hypothetical protein HanIR_Chr05g0230801 [Helianthus annuus]|nr:hypothetical protein HanIR_Chr05g0230801 [Helianthus annuus]
MGIRVLSGVYFREVLAYLLPLCNEDTGPVTPALIFRGVTHASFFQYAFGERFYHVFGNIDKTSIAPTQAIENRIITPVSPISGHTPAIKVCTKVPHNR